MCLLTLANIERDNRQGLTLCSRFHYSITHTQRSEERKSTADLPRTDASAINALICVCVSVCVCVYVLSSVTDERRQKTARDEKASRYLPSNDYPVVISFQSLQWHCSHSHCSSLHQTRLSLP